MMELNAMAVGAGAFGLPLIGVVTLLVSKIATGVAGATAQRAFFAIFVLATVATFRTMMAGEAAWLTHALTMAVMFIGAASVPASGDAERHPARRGA